ncbi:MAG TPA: thioesterase family protein [Thermomicrobiaceae bacterium]|nr:thioesterase family protein [Thermomicrobiaceae bacterium]
MRVTEHEIWVRSTDMDADGIVNNARYFEYFEQARLEHLVALEIVGRPRPPGDRRRTFTIAETTCRFRAPARHRDRLLARVWTEEIRQRSFILGYELVRVDDGTQVAVGSSAQVWLDADGKPTPLPDSVREALEQSRS